MTAASILNSSVNSLSWDLSFWKRCFMFSAIKCNLAEQATIMSITNIPLASKTTMSNSISVLFDCWIKIVHMLQISLFSCDECESVKFIWFLRGEMCIAVDVAVKFIEWQKSLGPVFFHPALAKLKLYNYEWNCRWKVAWKRKTCKCPCYTMKRRKRQKKITIIHLL